MPYKPGQTEESTGAIYAAIVADIESGTSMAAAMRKANRVGAQALYKWMEKHPELKARYERAIYSPGRRYWVVKPDVWERVLEAAAECASVLEVSQRPGLPAEGAIYAKLERDSDFREKFRAACPSRRLITDDDIERAVQAVEGGLSLSQLHKHGYMHRTLLADRRKLDRALDARVLAAVEKQKPFSEADKKRIISDVLESVKRGKSIRQATADVKVGRVTVWQWRLKDETLGPQFDPVRRVVRRYTDAEWSSALSLLQQGRGIGSLADMGFPAKCSFYSRSKRDPVFAAQLANACQAGRWLALDSELSYRRALTQNEIYAAVDKVLGRGLDPTVREEVRGDMILAVLDGTISEHEISSATARVFLSGYHRDAGTYNARSFDAPVFSDGSRTLHDIFAS